MDHDEAQLWSMARGGDAQAFAAIFDLHRDRVFRQAVLLLDSWPDAEDVSASAFLELFRRRDSPTDVDIRSAMECAVPKEGPKRRAPS